LEQVHKQEVERWSCPKPAILSLGLRAEHVFESYSVAATEYFEAAHKLANLVGSHDEFAAAQQHAMQTGGKC
jgi:hypothetical protein